MKRYLGINFVSVLTMTLIMTSCASPIVNAQDKRSGAAVEKANAQEVEGENMIKAYGCPNKFPDLNLCVQVIWLDGQRRVALGPIYYENYEKISTAAHLRFWSSEDGWPVDPLEEFSVAAKKDLQKTEGSLQSIQVKPYMPTMKHGTMGYYPVVTKVSNRVGQYNVNNIRFIMGASNRHAWDFRIQLKYAHDEKMDFDTPEDAGVWKQVILKFHSIESR